MTDHEVSLADFCETGSGTTPSRARLDEYYGGNIPWVKSGELRDAILNLTEEFVTDEGVRAGRLKLVPPGSILVAMYGATVGRTALLAIEATTNQAVCHVRPDPRRADTRYVWFALKAKLPELLARRVGGAQPNISQETIRSTRVRLPPLPEQRRIADILDKADAIRRKRKEAIALTEELLRSAFLEMFGDPVTNPKGWPVTPLTDLCESKQYGTAEKANSDGHGMPVLRMNNLTYGGELDLTSLKWVSLTREEAAKLDLRDGDVLFNRVNSHELVGKTAVWHAGEGYTFAGYLIRLRIRSTAATGDYVSSAMNMPSMKRTLMTMAKPSINMANISGSDLARVLIPVPPLDLQRKYDGVKQALATMRFAYRQSVGDGDVLFDSLVHRAFSGGLGTSDPKLGQLKLFPR